MNLIYSLKKGFLNFLGATYVYKYPMFLTYKPMHHKVKGIELRQISYKIQPGDILLRRYDGYLNTIMMRVIDKIGFWGHAGLFVGDNNVIHALGVGVISEDILDFGRCDSICVLRPKVMDDIKEKAITIALKLEQDRVGYDYEFKTNNPNDSRVYCTELVDEAYNWMFAHDYEIKLGVRSLLPDGIFSSDLVEKILVFKH